MHASSLPPPPAHLLDIYASFPPPAPPHLAQILSPFRPEVRSIESIDNFDKIWTDLPPTVRWGGRFDGSHVMVPLLQT